MPAAQSRRVVSATSRLEHMVKHGLLTEADGNEVVCLLSTLAARVRQGDISAHFADFIVQKLAAAKCAAWRARNRRGGQ
jgi:hypothetical protein